MDERDILKQYKPLIDSTVRAYSGNVPANLVQLEAEIIARNAIRSYDPNRASLGTHLKTQLKQMNRIINDASPIYIPESRASKYNKYLTIRENKERSLGREPTISEMADAMHMNVNDIKMLSKETNTKLITDENIPNAYHMSYDPGFNELDVLERLHKNISDQKSKEILEHVFGIHNKPVLKTNRELAKVTNLSESGVRKKKDKIIAELKEIING
jgi:DNA-directed RNA polymerase specialized sigma subunit